MDKQVNKEVLGIIAGNGSLPLQLAEELKRRDLPFVIVAHINETNPEIAKYCDDVYWIKVGQLSAPLNFFKKQGVKSAVLVGGIARIKTLRSFRPDLRGLKLIWRAQSFRDDAILRAIISEIENEGIKIISVADLLPDILVNEGVLTRRALSEAERADAEIALEAARLIGKADIGQTVVAKNKTIVAVEGIEGTDATIKRAGQLVGAGCVVVKILKPHQDQRADLPVIGERTIQSMREAMASALVVQAGKTIILDPNGVVNGANKFGMAIEAWSV